jgi:predicted aspartyl protease
LPILNLRISVKARDAKGAQVGVKKGFGLQTIGPRVPVIIFPSSKGQLSHEPVAGYGLLDTGASMTCVDREAAEKAGLTVAGEAPMGSATHASEMVPLYAGNLRIEGLPDYKLTRAYGANLQPYKLVALIGRDMMASCVLIVNGLEGTVSMSL